MQLSLPEWFSAYSIPGLSSLDLSALGTMPKGAAKPLQRFKHCDMSLNSVQQWREPSMS